jgi:GNAT superfamily N-acetyltransferase
MIKIRTGTPSDLSAVHDLIRELAIYEKAEHEVETTPRSMIEDAFGPHKIFDFLVAEDNGKIIGIALYYYRYSTWKGKSIYLEDLVVTESRRSEGVGKMLFDELLVVCKKLNCTLLTWQVLDWNQPAINFYKKYPTEFDETWINCKIRTDGK